MPAHLGSLVSFAVQTQHVVCNRPDWRVLLGCVKPTVYLQYWLMLSGRRECDLRLTVKSHSCFRCALPLLHLPVFCSINQALEHAWAVAAAAVGMVGKADEWLQPVGGQAAAAGRLEAFGSRAGVCMSFGVT